MSARWIITVMAACFAVAIAFCQPVQANTYDFNATTGGVPGTANPVFQETGGTVTGCPCTGYETNLFVFGPTQFQAGDVINFGTLTLNPLSVGDQYGDIGVDAPGTFAANVNGNNPGFDQQLSMQTIFQCNWVNPTTGSACLSETNQIFSNTAPEVIDLVFTLGPGTTTIQMAWTTPYSYSPASDLVPTPLPGTLSLFASALCGLILFGRRRVRESVAAVV